MQGGGLGAGGSSLLPCLALVVLVVAVIPACRRFEQRWTRLPDADAANPALAARFRRDRRMLWGAALGLPFVITGAFRLLVMLAG